MAHTKSKNSNDPEQATLRKELAKPRMARSAKIAELKLDTSRVPERPSVSMPGVDKKIIPSTRSSRREKAQIAIDGADHGFRDLRIENVLTDEHGDNVRLKKNARVEVTVTTEPAPTSPVNE